MTFSTRVGKYELGRELGEGTFAKVKVARNIETGLNVAVKIIDKQMILRCNLTHQVKREISTMKLVKHPNIVRLYEVLASKKRIYLIMEYVTGGDLSDKIAYLQKITEKEARKYFHQLIDAVDYCHSRKVYHRDLKPQNILLDAQGNLKVSDFGLSVLHQTDTILSTTCGSPNYIAPEVVVSQNYYGAAADIWSCGVILFELLAGFSPFEDSNLFDQYRKICKAEYSFPLWFSYGARNLIAKILDPRPNSRMTIAQIYEDEWFKKSYNPPAEPCDEEDVTLDDVHAAFEITEEHLVTKDKQPVFINAFQLIAMSNDLDLSGFFEKENDGKNKKRFGSRLSAQETIEKMDDAAKNLGLSVERVNPCKIKIHGAKETGRRGSYLSVSTEVTEVAPSFSVVEIWKSAGDTIEYIKFYKSFSSILMDVPGSPKIVQLDCPRSEEDRHLTSASCQESCHTDLMSSQESCPADLTIKVSNFCIK
jgi:5'-AMP-activated protein kinase catalytic alpha subunit